LVRQDCKLLTDTGNAARLSHDQLGEGDDVGLEEDELAHPGRRGPAVPLLLAGRQRLLTFSRTDSLLRAAVIASFQGYAVRPMTLARLLRLFSR
jgi:hypothetical protein